MNSRNRISMERLADKYDADRFGNRNCKYFLEWNDGRRHEADTVEELKNLMEDMTNE